MLLKMTNWGIEAIYAFVYLKILPLFTEARKMGIVQQEASWGGSSPRLRADCTEAATGQSPRGSGAHGLAEQIPLAEPSLLREHH